MPRWQSGDSWLHYDYREDVSYVYINIPKNASSWMKENFGGYQYDWHNNQFRSPVNSAMTMRRGLEAAKHYVVILRDPIERWLSGFAQSFWGGDTRDPGYYANHAPEDWLDIITNDDHVRPQVGFLERLDHDRTTWFDCLPNLTNCVQQWMIGKFDHDIKDLHDDHENAYNVSARGSAWPSTGKRQQDIIDHVRSVITQQPIYQDQLRSLYSADLDLRKSVRFYGSR